MTDEHDSAAGAAMTDDLDEFFWERAAAVYANERNNALAELVRLRAALESIADDNPTICCPGCTARASVV